IDAQRVADLQFDLEIAILQKGPAAATVDSGASAGGPTHAEASPSVRRWRISFRPYPQLFVRGNDPLRMLRELAELGELGVAADVTCLPPLAELDPEACYVSWELTLSSEATRETIQQVFDWAEGDCEL